MIWISPRIHLPDQELKFDFIRASGPGGQNVNKVSSAVQLSFDVTNSPSLPANVRFRLSSLAKHLMTKEGILKIEAHTHRHQMQNRKEAVKRLIRLIQKAEIPIKKRKPTRPSAAAHHRRLTAKQQRGQIKKLRDKVRWSY